MPPGKIVHIDNLYVKTRAVKFNTVIVTGEYCIFDTDGLRPLVVGDFSADDRFLSIGTKPVFQAGHNANNLTTTAVNDRVTEVSVITVGSDWICKMAAGVEPSKRVGISRLDSRVPIIAVSDVANAVAPTITETLGQYKHKEFAQLASDSVLNDDGVISTGVL
jgi:hypothetical protein